VPRSDAVSCDKPAGMFDREAEWNTLASFARDPQPGPTLGVVRGRRRQGKTYLLHALAQATGGFYFCAQEATEADSLHQLADRFARHTGDAHPPHWRRWKDAIGALLALADLGPLPVVIDEFPHLVRQSPALPSVIHTAFRRLRNGPPGTRARLLRSGSALTVMNRLFAGPSPLRELAALELVVCALDFRQAATFWAIGDPRLALLVHAVVGGTPAYRHDFVADDVPAGLDDFDAWVCRTVLNPRIPLFQEARHLIEEEEPNHLDRALCHSTLSVIATGHTTCGQIAEYLGRPIIDAARAVTLLQNYGLLRSEPDAIRPSLTRERITEPLLAFDHAVLVPHRSELERGDTAAVWRRARAVFDRTVVASHFAQLCREWVLQFAAEATFDGTPETASHGCLTDAEHHTDLNAEVVVRGQADSRSGVLLSVGRARWDEVMGIEYLEQLRHLLTLLAARGEDISHARPACYSGTGFTPELRAAGARGEVILISLDTLYGTHRGP
jgi:hypothetical protein